MLAVRLLQDLLDSSLQTFTITHKEDWLSFDSDLEAEEHFAGSSPGKREREVFRAFSAIASARHSQHTQQPCSSANLRPPSTRLQISALGRFSDTRLRYSIILGLPFQECLLGAKHKTFFGWALLIFA